MQQNSNLTVCSDNVSKTNKDMLSKLTEYFTTYMSDMFGDMSKVISKKLYEQQKKIQQNQNHLKYLSKALAEKSLQSSTSLDEISSQKLIHQKSRKKISSFKQAKDFMSLEKISSILVNMQANVLYLQNSLTKLKRNKQIQDPQKITVQSKESLTLQEFKDKIPWQPTQTTLTSKISKLTSKITKLAKESSIEQIEKQNSSWLRKCQPPKSKSLLSISSRKYHPVSCPKKYDYGQGLGRNWSESEIDNQNGKQKQYGFKKQQLLKTLAPLKGAQKAINNKMPLINQTNYLLNNLLLSCQDEDDANVIKFHLKKAYKKIDQIIGEKKKSNKNILVEVNDRQNLSNTYATVPQYFASNKNSKPSLAQCEDQQNANPAQCSIVKNLPSEPNLNLVKQNYSSFHAKNSTQNDNETAKNHLNQTRDSRQKRKYFQRTSNDHKISMLKKRLKPEAMKF